MQDESAKCIEASRVIYDSSGNYIRFHGRPYLLSGIQIRPDRVIEQFDVSTDEEFTEYVEPLFRYCAEMGYKTVIFPIKWEQVEFGKDEYSFVLLQRYYAYAKKYDLTVQLLWFGSDNCGWNIFAPKYILEDTTTYSRLSCYPDVLDYSNANLIERECLVFQKLLDWLYENDKDCRTVSIQLLNEANHPAHKGAVLPPLHDITDEIFDAVAWCVGQKSAILHIIHELGKLVKTGPYRCVTRVNLVAPTYIWQNDAKYRGLAEEVLAEGNVDIVGYDSYSTGINMRTINILKSIKTNVAHWAEFGAGASNYVPMVLLTLSNRAGILGYHLKSVYKSPGAAIFNSMDNEWTWSTGEQYENSDLYRVDAYEVKALNIVLSKASEQIALNDVTKTHVFNTTRATTSNETAEIDGVEITFTNNEANGFGGCGYATMISNSEMLVFATRGNSSFKFAGKTVATAEAGSYVNGIWMVDEQIAVLDNAFHISSDMAKAGTLIRVTFN